MKIISTAENQALRLVIFMASDLQGTQIARP